MAHHVTMTRKDHRFVIGVVLFIILCAAFVRLNYSKAFPEASIDLRLSKAEITAEAERFLSAEGLSPRGFHNITLFDPDEDARLYLEREVGLEQANRLMQRDVAVWRWRARWFRPPDKEEMTVELSPDGRVVGYEHVIAEAAAGAKLDADAARRIAFQFVSRHAAAPGHIVEERAQQRPNRIDHLFTWEQDGFRAKDATYRRTIVVQGDRVGRYVEYLRIPESWRREFAGMRSRNELFAQIAQAFWLPLIVAAIALVVRGLRRRVIPWRPLIAISGVVGALTTLTQLNLLPLSIDRYPTSSPLPQTLVLLLLEALGAGMGVFFYIIIAGAAGEPLYRESRPGALSLRNGFTRKGMATREFFRASLAGYGLAAGHLAFLVAFYLLGRKVGVWSPQDVQYSDLLSTAMPWIYPVTIASMAATSEEFWFRLLAIPLLKRALRSTWLAVVIPAFVWGFLHANYPQQPAYIRGVEVGIIGVAAGIVMLRYGILATLIWHYAIDALLIGLYLFEAGNWYFRVSGWLLGLAILLPLLVSLWLYRRNRGFVVMEPEPAADAPLIDPPIETPALEPVQPSWPVWRLYAAACVALIAMLIARPHVFGGFIRVDLSRADAIRIARANIQNPDAWQMALDFTSNLSVTEFEYLRRIAGPQAADDAVREYKNTALWRARFFHAGEREERILYIDQQGRVVRRDHVLDENAPGASLTEDQARRIAEAALPRSGLTLVDSSRQARERRVDYSFVFEDPVFRIGEARARVSVEIRGDEPSNLRRFLKLPEAWVRDFETPTMRGFLVPAISGGFALPLLLLFLKRLASHETVLHWRAYGLVAGVALAALIFSAVNNWPMVLMGYDTATPLRNYVGQYLLGRVVMISLITLGVLASVVALDVFRQAMVGRARLNSASVARAIATALVIAGTVRALVWVTGLVPGPREALPLWGITGLDSYVPGWRVITQSYLTGVIAVCGAGVAIFAGLRYLDPRRRAALIVAVTVAVALSRSLTPMQFVVNALAVVVGVGVVALLARTCAVDLITFGVAVFWAVGLSAGGALAAQGSNSVRWNGVAAMVAVVAIGIAVIAGRNLRSSQSARDRE